MAAAVEAQMGAEAWAKLSELERAEATRTYSSDGPPIPTARTSPSGRWAHGVSRSTFDDPAVSSTSCSEKSGTGAGGGSGKASGVAGSGG